MRSDSGPYHDAECVSRYAVAAMQAMLSNPAIYIGTPTTTKQIDQLCRSAFWIGRSMYQLMGEEVAFWQKAIQDQEEKS